MYYIKMTKILVSRPDILTIWRRISPFIIAAFYPDLPDVLPAANSSQFRELKRFKLYIFLLLLSSRHLGEDHLFAGFPHPEAVKLQTASGKGGRNGTGSENRSQSQFRSEAILFVEAIAVHVPASASHRML